MLRGFFVRRGAREDADDLVQETYLRLLRADQRRDADIANPEAYLYTVALNIAREQAVRRKRNPISIAETEEVHTLLDGREAVDLAAERAQREERMFGVLARLPENTRTVLVLQYREGLSYQQIAERMQISTHMVKKHVVRGLSACRSALADHAGWP